MYIKYILTEGVKMTVKIRRVGTSDGLTVPKSIKKRYKEYEVYQDRNGAIVYMPKRNNPFRNSEFIAKHLYDGDDTGFIDGEVRDDELLH